MGTSTEIFNALEDCNVILNIVMQVVLKKTGQFRDPCLFKWATIDEFEKYLDLRHNILKNEDGLRGQTRYSVRPCRT